MYSLAETSSTSTASGATTDALNPSSSENQTGAGEVDSSEQTNPLDLDKPVKQPKQQAAPVEDDPEFDLDGVKVKKSDLFKRYKGADEIERESHKRFREAAEARKAIAAQEAKYKEAFEQLQSDPWSVHKIAGLTDEQVDALAESRLAAQIKRAQMTPEQVEAEKTKSEVEELRAWKAQQEQTAKAQREEQATRHWVGEFDKSVGTALSEHSLPKNERAVARMVETLIQYHEAKQPIDANMAAKLVKNELRTDTRSVIMDLAKSNPRELVDFLGPEVIKAVTDARVAAVSPQAQPRVQQAQVSKPQTKAPETFEDVKKRLKLKF